MSRRALLVAWFLALIHLGLAFAFASITPYLKPGVAQGQRLPDIGAPDEFVHIAYVRSIFEGRGLPVLRKGDADGYEAHQPPLYYAFAAGWARIIGVREMDSASTALRVRSLNAIFGAGIVLGVFFFSLWSTQRRQIALLSAAVAAFLPMLIAVDGAVSNDPITILLCTWTLALVVRFRGTTTPLQAALLGLLTGLAVLTKATGLVLVPVILLAVHRESRNHHWMNTTVASAILAVLAGPWLIRNQIVYGHPLAMTAFYATFERQVFPAEVFSGLRPFAHWLYVLSAGTGLSFVGIFGYMDIHLPYVLYVPILGILLLGLMLGVGKSVRLPIGLFVVLLVLSYLGYNLWQIQPQARYLFPAIAPISHWVALGLNRWRPPILTVALVALLVIADGYALTTLPGQFRQRVEAAQIRN